jgi:curved DNA-binding protein CbpA
MKLPPSQMAHVEFVDYYEFLQIPPSSEAETVQRVYSLLRARYHPDNPRSGDADLFWRLNQAYQVLSDPRKRAAYDKQHQDHTSRPMAAFETREFNGGIDNEGSRRMGLLCLLYARRRSNPDSPGISILQLERLMFCPREHMLFAIWYLKDANLLRQDQASDFAITALGVDYVEKNLSSYQSMQDMLKSAEVGEVERSQTDGEAPAPRDLAR